MTIAISDISLVVLIFQIMVIIVTLCINRLMISEMQQVVKEFRKKYDTWKPKKSDD